MISFVFTSIKLFFSDGTKLLKNTKMLNLLKPSWAQCCVCETWRWYHSKMKTPWRPSVGVSSRGLNVREGPLILRLQGTRREILMWNLQQVTIDQSHRLKVFSSSSGWRKCGLGWRVNNVTLNYLLQLLWHGNTSFLLLLVQATGTKQRVAC